MRHLARKFGLYGISEREHALVDMISDSVLEFRLKFNVVAYSPNFLKNEELTNLHYEKVVPESLAIFDGWLAANSSGFFVGSKMTYCDIQAFDCFSAHSEVRSGVLDAYPHIKKFMEMVSKTSRIEEYQKTRRPSDFANRT